MQTVLYGFQMKDNGPYELDSNGKQCVFPLVWKLYFQRVEQRSSQPILHPFRFETFTLSVIHSPRFPKRKQYLLLLLFSRIFSTISALQPSLWNSLKSFHDIYCMVESRYRSYKTETFRGRRLFPSKVSGQSRFYRLFRERKRFFLHKIHKIRVTNFFGNIPPLLDR